MIKTWMCILLASLCLMSCEGPVYSPKPRAYPKIEYPERTYRSFSESYCDFTFEYPTYAQVIRDSLFFDQVPVHPCWFDLYVPAFDSRLHCSYVPVTSEKSFDDLRNDAFDLANWHNKKANYIDEHLIDSPNGVKGIFFEFEGPVASPVQFFVTDAENRHFMRGALYMNTQIRPDSLAPIYDFLKTDIDRMLATFRWTN